MKLLPWLFVMLGCAHDATAPADDPVFASYKLRFNAAASKYNSRALAYVPVMFGTLSGNAVGMCYEMDSPADNYIVIVRKYWNTLDDAGREELLFHELGHCVLGRIHRTDVVANVPVSIMYPEVLDSISYSQRRDAYVLELFTVAP